jgi:5-methylcytosine-specific restriction endonuclease McrA
MRREFPAKVKLAAWKRCEGNCEQCGQKILGRGQYDHDKPDGLGGEPTLENCRVLCSPCHRDKTHEIDRPIMAKADAQMKAAAGIKTTRNPIPGSKASGWKRKLNGEVERR